MGGLEADRLPAARVEGCGRHGPKKPTSTGGFGVLVLRNRIVESFESLNR